MRLCPTPMRAATSGHYEYASNCGCQFYKSAYPFALGPRLGCRLSDQQQDRVSRWMGIELPVRCATPPAVTVSTNGVYNRCRPTARPTFPTANQFVNVEVPGAIQLPTMARHESVSLSAARFTSPAPTVPDAQENRPPRINTYSVGFQREITRSFVMEADYIGNHAVWIGGGSGPPEPTLAAIIGVVWLVPYSWNRTGGI